MNKNKLRVLVLCSEVWNDSINGNNVLSNWFEGMDVELANIYGSPGIPENKCCKRYFQITDAMMARSLVGGVKAGREIHIFGDSAIADSDYIAEEESKILYDALRRMSGSFLRLARELLWNFGRYDLEAMRRFIKDFSPDIIFSIRMATVKMLRLEKTVAELCDAPMVAFTGDDEYSLRQISFSPFFWWNRFMVRRRLRKMVHKYQIYYTLSREQAEDYRQRFECEMKLLQKCGERKPATEKVPHTPIRLIYAGKLYCNRWKVLAQIVKVVTSINASGIKMVLDIYTADGITRRQNRLLNDQINSYIHLPVSKEELAEKYKESDLALHVESTDIVNRLRTRLSFSTKIMDCLFSGCAVMAFCWEKHSGWAYLKAMDAAICVSSKEELDHKLNEIEKRPEILDEYRIKARKCAEENHLRKNVQEELLNDLRRVALCRS